MKKIKIAFFINSFKNCGPANILLSMLNGINREKFIPYLVTLLNENDEVYIKKVKNIGVNVIQLNEKKEFCTLLKGKELCNKLNKYDFDIVHFHSHIVSFIFKNMKAKKIVTIHNKLYEDFKETYGKMLGFLVTKIYIRVIKKFDKIVCCSKSSYDICRKYLKNIVYVRNGMWFEKDMKDDQDAIRKRIRKELKIPNDALVYVYAGNYNKNKNIITLLKYFEKSLDENEYLITLGKGELLDEAQQIKHKRIRQLGFKENIYDYYIASDIYTSFSLTEGFSVSIIEALHFDLKLLLSDIDSHRECLEINDDYDIGKLFESGNFENFVLKKKLVTKVKNSRSKEFQERFLSEKNMMVEYEKIYESLN